MKTIRNMLINYYERKADRLDRNMLRAEGDVARVNVMGNELYALEDKLNRLKKGA